MSAFKEGSIWSLFLEEEEVAAAGSEIYYQNQRLCN